MKNKHKLWQLVIGYLVVMPPTFLLCYYTGGIMPLFWAYQAGLTAMLVATIFIMRK